MSSLDRGGTEAHTWALDVSDNASVGVVHEFNADLSDTSSGTYSK